MTPFIGLFLFVVGVWIAILIVLHRAEKDKEREQEKAQLTPCEWCGKPVLAGGEAYHRSRCLKKPKELRVESRWKGGPRE